MTPKQMEEIFQFLAGYWYDRDETDAEIVNEIISELDTQSLHSRIQLLKIFLDSNESNKVKAEFIKKCVWKYFPDDSEIPIDWLKEIYLSLQKSM